jgi:hypothetical protein
MIVRLRFLSAAAAASLLLLLPTAVTALMPTAGVWVTRRLHLNYRGAGPRVPLSLYKYTCSEYIINGWLCKKKITF